MKANRSNDSDKELGQSDDDVREQAVIACSYVIEEDNDKKKKETLPPAEGIPMLAKNLSSFSFVADESRLLAESLIDTQKSELAFLRDLAKNQQDTITTKKVKIAKLKEKLVFCETKAANEKSNHVQELQVKDSELTNL